MDEQLILTKHKYSQPFRCHISAFGYCYESNAWNAVQHELCVFLTKLLGKFLNCTWFEDTCSLKVFPKNAVEDAIRALLLHSMHSIRNS